MPSLADHFHRPGFTLRRLRRSDYPVVVPLINDAFSYQDAARGGETRTNPKHLEWLDGITEFYVILEGDEIVGCVHTEPEGNGVFFGLLTVVPQLRKTGLARAVITAVENYSRALNAECVRLGVMSISPWLKHYYERLGYSATGKVEPRQGIDI
ncbi:MAG: GCN5-related N-acetyltransferase, partial [Candidatus Saccharibacteria bacterium]|nr:GCN5-related N-acetyltransferase [Candidatus Saccharibacteria bacterium]